MSSRRADLQLGWSLPHWSPQQSPSLSIGAIASHAMTCESHSGKGLPSFGRSLDGSNQGR